MNDTEIEVGQVWLFRGVGSAPHVVAIHDDGLIELAGNMGKTFTMSEDELRRMCECIGTIEDLRGRTICL